MAEPRSPFKKWLGKTKLQKEVQIVTATPLPPPMLQSSGGAAQRAQRKPIPVIMGNSTVYKEPNSPHMHMRSPVGSLSPQQYRTPRTFAPLPDDIPTPRHFITEDDNVPIYSPKISATTPLRSFKQKMELETITQTPQATAPNISPSSSLSSSFQSYGPSRSRTDESPTTSSMSSESSQIYAASKQVNGQMFPSEQERRKLEGVQTFPLAEQTQSYTFELQQAPPHSSPVYTSPVHALPQPYFAPWPNFAHSASPPRRRSSTSPPRPQRVTHPPIIRSLSDYQSRIPLATPRPVSPTIHNVPSSTPSLFLPSSTPPSKVPESVVNPSDDIDVERIDFERTASFSTFRIPSLAYSRNNSLETHIAALIDKHITILEEPTEGLLNKLTSHSPSQRKFEPAALAQPPANATVTPPLTTSLSRISPVLEILSPTFNLPLIKTNMMTSMSDPALSSIRKFVPRVQRSESPTLGMPETPIKTDNSSRINSRFNPPGNYLSSPCPRPYENVDASCSHPWSSPPKSPLPSIPRGNVLTSPESSERVASIDFQPRSLSTRARMQAAYQQSHWPISTDIASILTPYKPLSSRVPSVYEAPYRPELISKHDERIDQIAYRDETEDTRTFDDSIKDKILPLSPLAWKSEDTTVRCVARSEKTTKVLQVVVVLESRTIKWRTGQPKNPVFIKITDEMLDALEIPDVHRESSQTLTIGIVDENGFTVSRVARCPTHKTKCYNCVGLSYDDLCLTCLGEGKTKGKKCWICNGNGSFYCQPCGNRTRIECKTCNKMERPGSVLQFAYLQINRELVVETVLLESQDDLSSANELFSKMLSNVPDRQSPVAAGAAVKSTRGYIFKAQNFVTRTKAFFEVIDGLDDVKGLDEPPTGETMNCTPLANKGTILVHNK